MRGLLGIAATAAAAPLMKYLPAPAAPEVSYRYIYTFRNQSTGLETPASATIEQYADYTSLSDLALGEPAFELVDIMKFPVPYSLAHRWRRNDLRGAPFVIHREYLDGRQIAAIRRDIRRERYVAKQRRRSARMAA